MSEASTVTSHSAFAMDGARLNMDILLVVLSFADSDTTLQLMQTCRSLNHFGAKSLLDRCVKLDTESKQAVVSFMSFLSRDSRYRLYHFQRLELTRSTFPPLPTTLEVDEIGRLLEALFRLLARSGNLQCLTIEDVEVVLNVKSDLAGAISGVRTLKSLHLTYVGPCAAKMLRKSQSTFEDIDIAMFSDYEETTEEDDSDDDGDDDGDEDSDDDSDDNSTDDDRSDEDSDEDNDEDVDNGGETGEDEEELPSLDNRRLTHILFNSRNSLRALGMWGSGGVHDGPRYPLLSDLFIGYIDKPRTRNHVHVSPNLRYLLAIDCNTSDRFSVPGAYEQLRSKNQREQARYGTWSSLWHFDGELSTLFVLAPACHIHALDIYAKECVPEAVGMLRSCVDDAHPRHIHLSSHSARWLLDADFLSTWIRPALQSLVHLQLDLHYRNGEEADPELDIDCGLDNVVLHIVPALRSLRSFSLYLEAEPYTTPGPPTATHPLGALEWAREEWDMDAFACRVRAAGASGPLESVAIRVQRHRTRTERIVQLGPVYALGKAPINFGGGPAVIV